MHKVAMRILGIMQDAICVNVNVFYPNDAQCWVQGRITSLAEQLGIDYVAARHEDIRHLHELLLVRVYPKNLDFSAWDAADAALELLEVCI
jgi:hypothetical protein